MTEGKIAPPRLAAFSKPAMACPLCGEVCTCSQGSAASTFFDPDAIDTSEQQFSASLEKAGKQELSATREGVARVSDPGTRVKDPSHTAQQNQTLGRSIPETNLAVDEHAMWRDEVSSRLESFRARRRRPVRERSLPLDFERAVNREITLGNLSSEPEQFAGEADPAVEAHEPAPVTMENPEREEQLIAGIADFAFREQEVQPVEESETIEEYSPPEERKIIEFPRQQMLPVMPPSSEELAEPMVNRPRILDAPEEVDATAPLADISVAPEEEPAPIEFELPMQVAPIWQRAFAGFVDMLVALIAALVFFSLLLKLGLPVPHSKAGLMIALLPACVLWAIYEYVFLVYGGVTLGMQMAGLRLVTFDGLTPRNGTRRGRALAMLLSVVSLGLGIVWALLDEDTLCWHDRITRTYVVTRSS